MKIDVVLLPGMLKGEELGVCAVVVFDVLRATTSMTAALGVGVREIRVFGSLELAEEAGRVCGVEHLLCGERDAVKPVGFDLGNSPGGFTAEVTRGKTLLMSTTNGTKAILAAKGAGRIFVGALVNARAVAGALVKSGLDVTLLCSGTQGEIALEDVLGAGAVIEEVRRLGAEAGVEVELRSDTAQIAEGVFRERKGDLAGALAGSRGGRNVQRAGLMEDIGFCARLNVLEVVGEVKGEEPVVGVWGGR